LKQKLSLNGILEKISRQNAKNPAQLKHEKLNSNEAYLPLLLLRLSLGPMDTNQNSKFVLYKLQPTTGEGNRNLSTAYDDTAVPACFVDCGVICD